MYADTEDIGSVSSPQPGNRITPVRIFTGLSAAFLLILVSSPLWLWGLYLLGMTFPNLCNVP